MNDSSEEQWNRMHISAQMDWLRSRLKDREALTFYLIMALLFTLPMGTSPPTIFGIAAVMVWMVSGKWSDVMERCLRKRWCWPVLLLVILPWVGMTYSPDPWGLGLKFAKKKPLLDLRYRGLLHFLPSPCTGWID